MADRSILDLGRRAPCPLAVLLTRIGRREIILQRAWNLFPQRKAGSKGRQDPLAEVRPFQGGTTALGSEGIALPAGPGRSRKLGVGK